MKSTSSLVWACSKGTCESQAGTEKPDHPDTSNDFQTIREYHSSLESEAQEKQPPSHGSDAPDVGSDQETRSPETATLRGLDKRHETQVLQTNAPV